MPEPEVILFMLATTAIWIAGLYRLGASAKAAAIPLMLGIAVLGLSALWVNSVHDSHGSYRGSVAFAIGMFDFFIALPAFAILALVVGAKFMVERRRAAIR